MNANLLTVAAPILHFGGAGLAFLLAFMAYAILRRQAKTSARSGEMFRTLRWFMVYAGILAIVSIAADAIPKPVEARAIPCNQVKGYPVGQWLQAGLVKRATPPHSTDVALAYAMTLISKTRGLVTTNQAGAREADVTIDGAFKPGSAITFIIEDSTGYSSTLNGTLSSDGCSIEGDWDDTNTHVGHSILIWDVRGRYRVL